MRGACGEGTRGIRTPERICSNHSLVQFVLCKHFGHEKQDGKIAAVPDGLLKHSTYPALHIFKALQEPPTN